MKVPLIDLTVQYAALKAEIAPAVARVCDSQQFILGPEVEAFERAAAEFLKAGFAIGTSSGSDALLCSLLALDIGPGDEVITTPFTFVATAEAIARAGATPVFADICPNTLNLDPERAKRAITPRTRAILVVHLFGQPAQLDELSSLAEQQGLVLVEDAAQAFGSTFLGRSAGTWGKLGTFSFFPSKPLGGFGDGGLVVTDDRALAERCRMLRVHGSSGDRRFVGLGGNFRLDELQAAVLGVKLRHVNDWLCARRDHAGAYDEAFGGMHGLAPVRSVAESASAYAYYTLRVRDGRRDALARHLSNRGVQTAVYYPRPLHCEPCFAHLNLERGALPVSEQAAAEVLSLPLYPELTLEQRDYVIGAVREFFEA